MSGEHILVYRPDDEAPSSVRTYTRQEAIEHANALNDSHRGRGRWTVHELSEEVAP